MHTACERGISPGDTLALMTRDQCGVAPLYDTDTDILVIAKRRFKAGGVCANSRMPRRGATCQPRATPWDHGNSRVIRALKGRHTSETVLPFQGNCGGKGGGCFCAGARSPRALPCAALWLPLRGGCGQTAQHQKAHAGISIRRPGRRGGPIADNRHPMRPRKVADPGLGDLSVEALKPGFRFRQWARPVDAIKSLAWNSAYRA